jgi:glyoxylase-like metal-dependent hydrolase (beta-lactamase superfamily II)
MPLGQRAAPTILLVATRTTARCRRIILFWVIADAGRAFLVDSGFTAETAARRKRQFLRCPTESLRLLGIEPDSITDVMLTHLHYNHVGNFHKLPNARFHLQERELAFATGRHMRYPYFGHGFEVEDVVGMVRLNFKRRLELYDGDTELALGVVVMETASHRGFLSLSFTPMEGMHQQAPEY